MAQIPNIDPSYETLKNPLQAQPTTSVVGYDPDAPALATQQLGKTGQDIANDVADKQTAVAVAQAKSNLMTAAFTAERAAEQDPDPNSAKQNYYATVNAAAKQGAQNIPDVFAAKLFQANTGDITQWSERNLDQILINKQKSINLAGIMQTDQDQLDNYSRQADPAARQAILENHQQYLTTMVKNGTLTPEQFQQMSQNFSYKASVAYYGLHPNELAPDVDKKIGSASSSLGSNPNNLGNVKTTQGAAAGTAEFQQPATPVDGVILTANNLRSGYQGMTLQQIGTKWTGESPAKIADWVGNVSKASGIAAGEVPDMNNPQQMSALLKGIATAEKSPADKARFTDDVIAQGVSGALSGKQPTLGQPTANSPTGNIPNNPTGKPVDNIPAYEALTLANEARRNQKVLQEANKQQYQQQVEQFASNPHFTSMLTVPDAITTGFADNPKMRDYLEQRAEYNLKNSQNIVDADTKQYGSGFYNLLQNINSPNGLSDVNQLYQYTGKTGTLTIPGFDLLKSEIAQKQTPQGQAVSEAKGKLFDMGANAIFGDARNYGVQDPKGEELHSKWMAIALNDYNAGVKAGKTPTQLLDPESPDYVGKSIAMFQRSDAEKLKDQVNLRPRTLDTVASDVQFGRMTPDQAKTEAPQLIRSEYAARRMTKDQVRNEMIRFGLLNGTPTTPGLRPPRPGLDEAE